MYPIVVILYKENVLYPIVVVVQGESTVSSDGGGYPGVDRSTDGGG